MHRCYTRRSAAIPNGLPKRISPTWRRRSVSLVSARPYGNHRGGEGWWNSAWPLPWGNGYAWSGGGACVPHAGARRALRHAGGPAPGARHGPVACRTNERLVTGGRMEKIHVLSLSRSLSRYFCGAFEVPTCITRQPGPEEANARSSVKPLP